MKKIFGLLVVLSSFNFAVALGENEVVETQGGFGSLLSLFSTETLLNVIFAVVIIIVTFVISIIVRTKLFVYLEKSSISGNDGSRTELVGLITRTVNIVIFITGFSVTLGILGVDLGIFMGGIGFGIGFTLKTFLTNFVSGIIMITQGKFNNGDLIEIGNKRGKIITINALFTEIEQLDGIVSYIPNIKFLEDEVSNFHTNDKRRLEIEVLVDYSTDITKAKKIIARVLENFPMILKSPTHSVVIDKLGDSGILIRILFWTSSKESYIAIKSNVTETVNLAFRQSDIQIAFPHIKVLK